jgi:hypothetical protein
MRPRHPDTDLIPYLSRALPPGDRERLSRHLGQCARCAGTAEAFGTLLHDLRRTTPRPPGVEPARYGPELRARIERRRRRRPALGRLARLTAVPLAVSAGVVSLLLPLTTEPALQRPELQGEPPGIEATAALAEPDLLQHGPIAEPPDAGGDRVERVGLGATGAPGRHVERLERLRPRERGLGLDDSRSYDRSHLQREESPSGERR